MAGFFIPVNKSLPFSFIRPSFCYNFLMKIAVFTKKTTFHKGYGGLETQNKVLCEGLTGRGHSVTVFSPKWDLDLDEANEKRIKYIFVDCVYRMGPVFGFFGTMQKKNWINRSFEEFSKLHEKGKFDLVLAQSSAGLGVIKRKRELGVKVISISHGSITGEYKTFLSSMELPRDLLLLIKNTGFAAKNFFRRQREFVHGSDKIIAVSNFVKESIIDETFVMDRKIEVIHNGVDPESFFEQDKKISRGNKILYVGQIIKSKGMLDLMKMFISSTEFSNLKIDLVGAGELLGMLQSRSIHDPKLKDSVNFLGKVPYDELVDKYYKNKEYGLFVLPTKRYEGFPMVLVEAMFSALPIVAYDKGGVRDAIEDGENGFLVKQDDINGFKAKVLQVVEDEDLRKKMSNNALKTAYEKYTLSSMLDKYEKVIREVTSENS